MCVPRIEKFPVQLLGLDVIHADPEIQSRVKMSTEHVRLFSEWMLDGKEFDPIDVFFDGKDYWLANGFHRYTGQRHASQINKDLVNIKVTVRPGTRRDAIIFSAGSNKEICIPRSREDIRKAIRLLLGDPEWFVRSDGVIADHVGCSGNLVRRTRVAFCSEKDLEVPRELIDRKGEVSFSPPPKGAPISTRAIDKHPKSNGLRAKVEGDRVYLGTDPMDARERLVDIEKSVDLERAKLSGKYLDHFLLKNGIIIKFIGNEIHVGDSQKIFVAGDFVCVVARLDLSDTIPWAVGSLVLAQYSRGDDLSPAVICRPQDGQPRLVDLARRFGIKFLTPDELVAEINCVEQKV